MSAKYLRFLFYALLCASAMFGQNPAQPLQDKTHTADADPAKQPGPKSAVSDAYVIEKLVTTVAYQSDGTGTLERTSRVRIQSDAGLHQFGVLVFAYQKAFETVEVAYVRVHKPDGKTIDTPLTTIQDIDSEITRAAPFYSDFREKHVIVKSLAVGDVVEWQMLTRELKPRVPGQFWLNYNFSRHSIVLDEELLLSIPRDVYVKVKSAKVSPQIQEESGRRLYEWKQAQLKYEEDPKERFRPAFLQPAPDVQISSFRSWDEVGRWYDSLQKNRVVPSPEVSAKAAEITKDAKSDDDKIRALYNYVSTNFRYVGVAFGIGTYQPHSADEVLSNGYGDCKDKHTLLASLLKAAGIEAWPALIGSSHETDPDVPSPAQFDHVITAVHTGKDTKNLLWLDVTSEVAPFEQLLINLRDKHALVIPANASASLIKTPEEPAFAGSEQFQIHGTLSDSGELQGTVDHQLRGDAEIFVRSAFRRVPQQQWKELIQRMSYALGYSGIVSDVNASNPMNTVDPFRFSYKFDRKDYSEWVNKRITAPLPSLRLPWLNDEHEKSGEPVQLDAPDDITYTADIQLPSGYTPRLPQNVDLKSDFGEYHSRYSLENGTLHAERRLIVTKRHVPSAQYANYRDFVRKVSDDEGAWILFADKSTSAQTPSSGGVPSPSPGSSVAASSGNSTVLAWPAPPNTEAGQLYRQGLILGRAQNYHGALDKFQAAAKLDSKLPGVWTPMGQTLMNLNENTEGIEAMRRQIKETPDLVPAYKVLGSVLLSQRRPAEASPIWREVLKLAPADRDAPGYLGNSLLATRQYYEAVEQLETATRFNPKNSAIYVQLGSAYLGAGNQDKAYEAFAKAVELDSTYSGARNDAAYALADNSAHLVEASAWAQQAVDDKENETHTLDLERLDPKDLRLMSQLSAYWDTVGWIHFRKDEYEPAERYLLAAWWLRQDTIVGDHLGQLYEKLNNQRKAVQFYSLAIACPDTRDKIRSRERLVHLFTAGASPDGRRDARAELGLMRTIHLPRLTPKQASAEFFVLLTNNGEERPPVTERSTKVATAESPASPNDAIKAKRLLPASDAPLSGVSNRHVSVEQVKFISGSDELRKAEESLRKSDFGAQFPDTSLTKIVRRGILVCEPGHSGCEFVLMSAESVQKVN
jgi:tetratricopeptide (TPR) repeat protein